MSRSNLWPEVRRFPRAHTGLVVSLLRQIDPFSPQLRQQRGSLRAMVITLGEIHYQAFGNLLHRVQTGSPAFNNVFGASLFDDLRQNVDAADAFNQGMANVSSMLAYAVLAACDFAESLPSS